MSRTSDGITRGDMVLKLAAAAGLTAARIAPAAVAAGRSFVADVKQYDLWYFPGGIPHSIQGLEPDGAEFMLVFDDGDFSESETVLLSDCVAHVPRDVLAKNFAVPESGLKNLPKQELF